MLELELQIAELNRSINYEDGKTQSEKFFKLLESFNKISRIDFTAATGDDENIMLRVACTIIIYLTSTNEPPTFVSYDNFLETKDLISHIALNSNPLIFDHALTFVLEANSDGTISAEKMLKAYLLCTSETMIFEKHEPILRQNSFLYINTLYSFIYSCSGTKESSINREYALDSLMHFHIPFECLPLFTLNGVMMNSAYAFTHNKDLFKEKINQSIRNEYKKYDINSKSNIENKKKKTIFVLLEVFNMHHSVYRVLGPSIKALRNKYTVIGIFWPKIVSHVPDGIFDELIELKGNTQNFSSDELNDLAQKYNPSCVYYPSIGMAQYGIVWSNIRLADIQIVGIGHGASSYGTQIDYFAIEDDIAGDQNTYSEKLLRLPPGSMPYYPPTGITYNKSTIKNENILSICCIASSMKLNYKFLETCKKIFEKATLQQGQQRIEFNFYIGSRLNGLHSLSLRKLVNSYLPTAKINFQQPFQTYIDELSKNSLMLTPFPFGGMNGLIDCAKLGIPAICLRGKFVHEAFDAGMWSRIGLENELVADTIDIYIDKALECIQNKDKRTLIQDHLIKTNLDQIFFQEPSHDFPDEIEKLILKQTN